MLQFNSILDINDGPQQRIAKGKEGGLVGGPRRCGSSGPRELAAGAGGGGGR